jgi:hypothetical protein
MLIPFYLRPCFLMRIAGYLGLAAMLFVSTVVPLIHPSFHKHKFECQDHFGSVGTSSTPISFPHSTDCFAYLHCEHRLLTRYEEPRKHPICSICSFLAVFKVHKTNNIKLETTFAAFSGTITAPPRTAHSIYPDFPILPRAPPPPTGS